jgi:hypothetical protein
MSNCRQCGFNNWRYWERRRRGTVATVRVCRECQRRQQAKRRKTKQVPRKVERSSLVSVLQDYMFIKESEGGTVKEIAPRVGYARPESLVRRVDRAIKDGKLPEGFTL